LIVGLCVVAMGVGLGSRRAGAEKKGVYIPSPMAFSGAKKKAPSYSKVLHEAEDKMGSNFVSYPYVAQTADAEDDKTLAPYFYVDGGDPEVDRLPLKKTSAEVKIAGVIAKVRVDQVFENDGKKPIEAVYVFPGSTRAAVHAMRMKIGERTIEAEIEEREEAKQLYEAAKADGKVASLLEQQRRNVFTMNVANIMPGAKIEVELDYSEMLVPEDAVYEFVYPTVVGPRYGGGADPEADKWISNPYLGEGEPEPYKWSIEVELETGIPLKEVTSPSHKVNVSYTGKSSARVALDQDGGGNKDFVLRYRLAGDQIESGVLHFEDGKENFFVVMMEPPEKPKSSQIPAREYIFVLDVSGSMHGFPLDTAKEVMKKLLGDLRSEDYFDVVLFAGQSARMSEKMMEASEANIQKALTLVFNQGGGGGTELLDGLKNAYSIPKTGKKGVSRTVVVVTDGYVGVEAQAFKFIRNNLDDTNCFAFGIGSSVNRALIEGMSRAGMGEPFVVLNPESAKKEATRFREYIEAPVLTDIEVEFSGFDVAEVLPEKVPDLMAKRPVVLIGKYKGDPNGTVKVSGISGGGKFSKTMDVAQAASGEKAEPIRFLWARKWVDLLEDQMNMLPGDDELKEAITDLGLRYTILTSQTSFVAIDSEIVNKGGSQQTVKQPLPLPEGVSNYAVGGGMAVQASTGMAYNAPMSPAPSGYAMPKMKKGYSKAEQKSADKDDLEAESTRDESKVNPVTFTFSKTSGKKLSLTKRKSLESLILSVIEPKLDSGKIPSGSTVYLTVTIKFDGDGKVASVKVSGDQGYGLAKAIEKKLSAVTGYKKIDAVEITVAVNAP
jgi:Ca-activated chloride channel family protein